MKLHQLREQRTAKVAAMKDLVDVAAAAGRDLTADESKQFDTLKAEERSLSASIERHEHLASLEARTAAPVGKDTAENLEQRISLVDAINAQLENRSLTGALREYNDEQRRQGQQARGVLVPHSLFEQRAAQTTTTAAGIVPEDFRADQFVGLLRNSLAVRSLGARVLPNLRGDTVIPRQKTASTAYWLAEGDSLTDSGLTFDNITLRPRHVGALTELSRQLLQQSNPAIEQLVRSDFQAVVAEAIDKALIYGDGVKEPLGILNTVGIQTGTLATLDWEAVQTMLEKLALANVSPNAWLTDPTVATKLRTTLKDSVAGASYLMEGGNLAGFPVSVTNQVNPADSNGGMAILGDFSELVIGTWGGVDVLANPYGSGVYERGGVQIRILTTMDMVIRRPEAFVIADDVSA
ncbi:phage major capsid protein [Pseudomonas aeruginosa]|nr:phage major capsid protein [Pseudomonas aeruginosa]